MGLIRRQLSSVLLIVTCLYAIICGNPLNEKIKKESTNKEVRCGVPHVQPNIHSRIINGIEAVPHSWPWQASLKVYLGTELHHFCGGSLINSRWILTAAHCMAFDNTELLMVVLGDHNKDDCCTTEKMLKVDKIIVHETYDTNKNKPQPNDIALMRLESEVEFTDEIIPACLPSNEAPDAVGQCVVSGWGLTKGTANASTLNQGSPPIRTSEECKQMLGKLPFTENMICAGNPDAMQDPSVGDSGGPLVCLANDKWVLQGVVSWGADPNKPPKNYLPTAFTQVIKYLDWISSHTKE